MSSVSADVPSPSRYQRRAVNVRSATGPHKNRQRFADTPIAAVEAAVATEKPSRVRINGRAIDTKPLLIPYGSTKKKKVSGFVEAGSRTD